MFPTPTISFNLKNSGFIPILPMVLFTSIPDQFRFFCLCSHRHISSEWSAGLTGVARAKYTCNAVNRIVGSFGLVITSEGVKACFVLKTLLMLYRFPIRLHLPEMPFTWRINSEPRGFKPHTYFAVYSTYFPISLNVSRIDITSEPSSNLFRISLQISKPKISTQPVHSVHSIQCGCARNSSIEHIHPPARLLT